MKKNIRVLVLAAMFALTTTAFGTLLLEENFSYPAGDSLIAHGWYLTGTNYIPAVYVHSSGLSYTGYASSGIGNAAKVDTAGQDVHQKYDSITTGTAYYAFIASIQKATTTGDYFTHLGPKTIGSAFVGRIHVKNDGNDSIAFGLSKGTDAATFTSYDYALNTTYLFVLKYEYFSGLTNDSVSLFIFTSGAPTSEPGTPTIGPKGASGSDLANVGAVALRQGSAANASRQIVDGIRIGQSWSDVLPPQGGVATQLAIISVNNNISPSVNTPFSIIVQAQDALGASANVTATTGILFSLATGSGILGGTLTGQIDSASNSATISGVTYNTAESGVSIIASRTSGDILAPDTSALFTVLPAASHLAFVDVPATALPGIAMDIFTVQARRPDSTIDLNFTGSVTVAKASGPGNVTGTLIKSCVAGVATFNDIVCSAAGAYTLDATAVGLTTAISSTINVIELPFPFIENFEYTSGTSLVSNGWSAHSGAGSNPVMVVSPGLTYAGYLGSGIGNAAKIDTAGEDVNKIFAAQDSGTIYTAFMMNVQKATLTGDYCFHLSTLPLATYEFVSRLHIKRDASNNIALGLGKRQSDTTFTGFSYALNTTYLVVIKYEIITGDSNDRLSMFTFSSGAPQTEPATPTIGPVTPIGTDPANLGSVILRQGSAANAPRVIIDGIRITPTWSISGTGIEENRLPLIADRITLQINPNPFTNFTHISFNTSPNLCQAIKIYDVMGNIIQTVAKPTSNQIIWNGTNNNNNLVAPGVYFIVLETGQSTIVKKLMIAR